MPSDTAIVSPCGKRITIFYHYKGHKYQITLPFNRSKLFNMASSVVLLKTETEYIDVTQQPGIPYLASPEELSSLEYVVQGEEDMIEYKTRPMYL